MPTTVRNAKRRSVHSPSCFYTALTSYVLISVSVCVCTEDHSEEDMYQIPAQCSLYSSYALWLRLGKRTVYQI